MLGHRIWGKKLGIIGMGRIGRAVARRAKAFGLSINYHNRRRVPAAVEEELGATYWESLDQMLAHMDIISVNCPHTPATFHLLSSRRLKLLKPTAYIVNTARGEVIDENALARMLEAGEIGGAGLDVFENEPAINPKLLKNNKVVVLPHLGLGDARRPPGHGREGDHQHPHLPRRPQSARPRSRRHVLTGGDRAGYRRAQEHCGATLQLCLGLTIVKYLFTRRRIMVRLVRRLGEAGISG